MVAELKTVAELKPNINDDQIVTELGSLADLLAKSNCT
jgi:hypothetical protein